MLNTIVHKLGNTTVVRCQGRIVVGDDYSILRNVVLAQARARMVVLDLAQVDRVDAGALGVLLSLRAWTGSSAIRFKLMNVMNKVLYVLELTRLNGVFEFCSAKDIFHLLHRSGLMARLSVDQYPGDSESVCNGTFKGQEGPVAVRTDGYLTSAT